MRKREGIGNSRHVELILRMRMLGGIPNSFSFSHLGASQKPISRHSAESMQHGDKDNEEKTITAS